MAEDFLAQVRTLNPDLKDYDDQTLAAAIGDQHPDYKPKLAKYFPDTASDVLSKQGAEGKTAPAEFAAEPEQVDPAAAFEKEHPDYGPFGLAEKGATALRSPETKAGIATLPPGVRQAAAVGAGVGAGALGMVTPGNAALGMTLPLLGPVGGRIAMGAFGAKGAYDTIMAIPELAKLWRQGDYDELLRKGSEVGLGGVVSTFLLAHGIKGPTAAPEAQPEAPPPADTSAGEAAAKGHAAVAKALADVAPKSAEAATEAAEAQKTHDDQMSAYLEAVRGEPFTQMERETYAHLEKLEAQGLISVEEKNFLNLMKARNADAVSDLLGDEWTADKSARALQERQGSPANSVIAKTAADWVKETQAKTVQGQHGEQVVPNADAAPEMTADLAAKLKANGVNPADPQAVATFLGQTYGLTKPVEVTSVGQDQVSSSSQTPDGYQLDLAKGTPDKVAHEIQHARQVEGQIPQVPEGEGANDQIVGQVAKDIDPTQKYAANLNLNRLQIPENAKAAIMEYADHLSRQAPIPRAQTIADAQALGFSLEDATKFADGTKDLHVQATAARQIEAWAADAYAKAAPEGKPAALKAMLSAMQAASDIAANLGRGLGSMAIDAAPNAPARAALEFGRLLQELEKKGKNTEALRQKLDATDLSDEGQRLKLRKAMGMKGASLNRKIGYYYVNSLISALPTWGVKAASDVATLLTSPLRTAAGVAMKGRNPIPETSARVAGMWSAVDDALSAFTQAIKTGSTVYSREPPITGIPGKVIGMPMRILGAITDAAMQPAIRGELYEQGIRDARNSGKTGTAAWEHAREYANDPPEEGLAKAQTEARIDTLTQPPGPILKSALHLREAVPGAVIQAPIVLTPQNLVKAAFQNSPLGFIDIARDLYKGEEVSNSKMGRAALGSMLWYWGYQMANAGKLTGAGPTDPKEFRKKLQTGWRPQSIQTPNGQYLPLRALGPIGYSLGTIADIVEIKNEAPRTANLEDYAVLSADHVMRFALEQPMVQGLADTFELAKNPRYIPIAAGRAAGGFVPSIVARAGAAMDDNQRRIDSFGSAIRARIPIYREGLPPKLDWRGRPVAEPGTPAERFSSPVARSEATGLSAPDLVYMDSKIQPIGNSINVFGKNFKLNREDLTRYEQLAGQIVDDKFKAIEQAPSVFDALSDDAQKLRVKTIVEAARERAKYDLVKELKKDGTYQAYVEGATGKAAAKAQANPYTEPLVVPGADKAQKILDRYGIPSFTKPGSVPEDLSDEFFKELDKQHAMIFYGPSQHPEEIGSLPPEEGREKVQQLEDLAVRQATKAVLGRAKKLSNAAPKAQNQGAEAP